MFVRYLGGGLYHTALRGIVNIADSLREILGSRVADADDTDSDDSDTSNDSDIEMDDYDGEAGGWNGVYGDGDWDTLGAAVEDRDSDASSGNLDTDDETWVIGQGPPDYHRYTL